MRHRRLARSSRPAAMIPHAAVQSLPLRPGVRGFTRPRILPELAQVLVTGVEVGALAFIVLLAFL